MIKLLLSFITSLIILKTTVTLDCKRNTEFIENGKCKKCNCKPNTICDITGACLNSCFDEYFGETCQYVRAYLTRSPRFQSSNCDQKRTLVFHKFQKGVDYGSSTLNVHRYVLYRRYEGNSPPLPLSPIDVNDCMSQSTVSECTTAVEVTSKQKQQFAVRVDYLYYDNRPAEDTLIYDNGSVANLKWTEAVAYPCSGDEDTQVQAVTLVKVRKSSASYEWQRPKSKRSISTYLYYYWLKKEGTEKSGSSSTASATLTGLTSGQEYQFRVRTRFTDNTLGAYADIQTFQTTSFSGDSSTISATSVGLQWYSAIQINKISSYLLSVNQIESELNDKALLQFNVTNISINNQKYSVTGLKPSGRYQFNFHINYMNGEIDSFSHSAWTKPTPILSGSLQAPVIHSPTVSSFIALIYPAVNYSGVITKYYLAVSKTDRLFKRATTEELNLPSNAAIVYETATIPHSGLNFTIGSGSPASNSPLSPYSRYRVYLVAESTAGGWSERASVQTSGETLAGASDITNILIIIFCLLAAFLLLIALTLICLYCCRKKSSYKPSEPTVKVKVPFQHHHPISYANWNSTDDIHEARYVVLNLKRGLSIFPKDFNHQKWSFQREFDHIPQGLLYPHSCAHLSVNSPLNRNPDLVPYDHSRVILREGRDYINASYIDGYLKRKEYIAAQSPFNKETTESFWTMVVQENVARIVMLTEIAEGGIVKCSQYWPDLRNEKSAVCTYGTIRVKILSEEMSANYIVRHLRVTRHRVTQDVRQYHFLDWQHEGVPYSLLDFLDFYNTVKMAADIKDGPLLVHCGTGTSRTGVFIAFDSLLQQMSHEKVVNVYRFCAKMNKCRPNMLRCVRNYMFLYDCLFERVLFTHRIINLDVDDTLRNLQRVNSHTSHSLLWEHFTILNIYTPLPDQSLDEAHQDTKHVKPFWLDGCAACDDMVLCDTPVNDVMRRSFWTLVKLEKISCVVGMGPHGGRAFDYLPVHPQSEIFISGADMTVRCTKVEHLHNNRVIVVFLNITFTNDRGHVTTREVTVYQPNFEWRQDTMVPDSSMTLVHLVHTVLSLRLNGPLLVHSEHAAVHAGLYALCHIACHKLTRDKYVDFCLIMKQIKMKRTDFLPTLAQYKFVYKVLRQWPAVALPHETAPLLGHIDESFSPRLDCTYNHTQWPVLHSHEVKGMSFATYNPYKSMESLPSLDPQDEDAATDHCYFYNDFVEA